MIYIDEMIILNFIIDYILLLTVSKILKLNVKKIRFVYSSLIGEISILYLFFNINNFFLCLFKLLLGVLMIYVCFGYEDYKSFIKNLFYFYIVSFFLGGTLYYFKIESLIKYQYYLLLIPLFMNLYSYFTYTLRNIISSKYKVTIYLKNGKMLFLNGYMDTGNNLVEPYFNKKVIIINKKVEASYFLVPYKTIDNESMLKCFNPKKVYIDGIGERKDIVVGVIDKKFNGFNCLLNNKLLEE